MSKVFKRIQRNVHIEGERERERGALIGGDRLTKGTLDAGLLWTSLADSTKGGQVNRIFKLSGPAPTPALVPASLLLSHVSLSLSLSVLGTSLCCRNGPASGCFVAVTYGLFEQSRAGLKCPTSREKERRERKKNAEKGNWSRETVEDQ